MAAVLEADSPAALAEAYQALPPMRRVLADDKLDAETAGMADLLLRCRLRPPHRTARW